MTERSEAELVALLKDPTFRIGYLHRTVVTLHDGLTRIAAGLPAESWERRHLEFAIEMAADTLALVEKADAS